MDIKTIVTKLAPRSVRYKAAHTGANVHCSPITLTHSVTFACQSKCKTCNIGHRWLENPKISDNDLSLEEIEKIYKSIGTIYFFNISGGEPFLRKDLPSIVELAMKYLKPGIVHTPTNALMPVKIKKQVIEILEIIKKYDPSVSFYC